MKQIINRVQSETPDFFKKLRTVGLVLVSIGGVVAASPVVLPAAVVTAAGYIAVAGGVISAVSQLTTTQDINSKNDSGGI